MALRVSVKRAETVGEAEGVPSARDALALEEALAALLAETVALGQPEGPFEVLGDLEELAQPEGALEAVRCEEAVERGVEERNGDSVARGVPVGSRGVGVKAALALGRAGVAEAQGSGVAEGVGQEVGVRREEGEVVGDQLAVPRAVTLWLEVTDRLPVGVMLTLLLEESLKKALEVALGQGRVVALGELVPVLVRAAVSVALPPLGLMDCVTV